MNISVMDTGYFPEQLGQFLDFRPNNSAGLEQFLFNGLPAVRITKGQTEILTVLVKSRFRVQIQTENQPARITEAFLRLVDLNRIAALSDAGADKLPNPVTIISVDELDPKKNSSYQLHWNVEDLDKSPPPR